MNADTKSATRAHYEAQAQAARFPEVSCSQCGGSFGPGDSGFSRCSEHASPLTRITFYSDTIGADVIAGLEIEETERHALFGSVGNNYLVELHLAGVDIAPHLTQATVDVILGEALTEARLQ